jgi:hypothetical protein
MSWSAPMTAVAGATFSAAQFNQYVRDNLNETGPAKVTALGQILVSTAANALAARTPDATVVTTSSTTAGTSYGDLAATTGPAVTQNTGTSALVWFGCALSNSGANASRASVVVSGASSIAANDQWAVINTGTAVFRMMTGHRFTGLTAGSNIFTMKYDVSAGTGTFLNRELIVIPL